MTFPTGTTISTANVASASSDPSLARQDFYDLIVAFNAILSSYNAAQGVLVLDGSAKIGTNQLPSTVAVTGNQVFQPSTGVVSIQNVLRLTQIYTADLGSQTGTTSPNAGDICYLVDGDVGRPCMAVYDGTAWRIVRLATRVGDVGAALTPRFTLTASVT
jgi:hypothetical protein